MRRKLRERSQPAAITRKRRRRCEEEPACEVKEEEILIPELDELLRSEDSAWWKEENGGRAADSSLADLLQQLCDEDCDSLEASPALPTNMAPTKPGAAPGSNKNAQAARLNRLRKKEYVRGLEGQVARLSEDNRRLEGERRELGERVHRLEAETRYLRAVLANDSALSHLLGRLTELGGVKLTTSLFSEREKKPREHDYALPAAEREPPSGGGVCLHVDQEKVSVEFCPACSRSASSSTKM